MVGTILGGRYEIMEEIGKGGMAYVYKARCILLNRIVAVKVLRDDFDESDDFLSQFNTEAQSAASLTHSNIVSIFDVGIDQGKHYIVMEYVDGITLKEYIVSKGKLDYREALDIAYQICDALQAAHDKNIVHRDIKPHNILVTDERNIKVTDFGIAYAGPAKTTESSEDILGSVHYISPEQAKGESFDNRSDLYSLGIAMYEMITGEVPFDADNPVAVARMQINDVASPIDDSNIPVSVCQIIFKAISKDPLMRYQNASEFKSDILNVIEDPEYRLPDGDLYYKDKKEQIESEKFVPEVKIKASSKFFAIFGGILTAIVIVSIGIFIYTSDIFSMIGINVTNKVYTVPDLAGMTLEEAQNACFGYNFQILAGDEVDDENFEPGTIVSQTPYASQKLEEGSTIQVVINKSYDYVLRDYIGSNYEESKSELEEYGYIVKIVESIGENNEGIVIKQEPEAGKKVYVGETVTLYVSVASN